MHYYAHCSPLSRMMIMMTRDDDKIRRRQYSPTPNSVSRSVNHLSLWQAVFIQCIVLRVRIKFQVQIHTSISCAYNETSI